jgi:hypothetical protein
MSLLAATVLLLVVLTAAVFGLADEIAAVRRRVFGA